MKTKILILVSFLLITGMVLGQEKEIVENGNYYLSQSISDEDISLDANSTFKKKENELKGHKYRLTVKSIEGEIVYFSFWRFGNNKLNESINGDEYLVKEIYQLPKKDFQKMTKPLYDRREWRVGFYTIPYKLRFDSFDFDANVNLGTNIGCKFRWNRERENGFAIEPILGIGLSSIKMDDNNSITDTATNVSAFTINTGILFHIISDVNIGLTWGFDHLTNYDQGNYRWKYNGKGWLGIGINVSFSKEAKNTSIQTNQ